MKNIFKTSISKALAIAWIVGSSLMTCCPAQAQTESVYTPIQQELGYDINYFIPEALSAAKALDEIGTPYFSKEHQPHSQQSGGYRFQEW